MSLSEEQIQKIRVDFLRMKTKLELLELLNYIKAVSYGEQSYPFTIRQLNFYCNPNRKGRYTVFQIRKKSGGERIIHSPIQGLLRIQESLKVMFECIAEVSPFAMGFVKGKSIVDNARIHEGCKFVFNTDLKDFFPSIDQARIWKRLQVPPFKLSEGLERRGIANIIAGLCCEKMEVERLNSDGQWVKVIASVLPQGAPTSPILSNIICANLDYKLSFMAKRFGMNYSRYADDITFSGDKDIFFNNRGRFIKELKRNIEEERFSINSAKTRLQKREYRQEVTGLVVNEFANIPKRYIKQLRMYLYYWESYGYERLSKYFIHAYVLDKWNLIEGTVPDFEFIIKGKLNYIKMVKGENDPTFKKLWERFTILTRQNVKVEATLSTWEKDGWEKAADQFYK